MKQKESYKMIKAINELFDKRIKHQRIKRYGERSKIRTAIREEPIKLAQYLRGEKERYEPAVIKLPSMYIPYNQGDASSLRLFLQHTRLVLLQTSDFSQKKFIPPSADLQFTAPLSPPPGTPPGQNAQKTKRFFPPARDPSLSWRGGFVRSLVLSALQH